MKLTKRKLLTIVTEAIIESMLIEDLKKLGVHGYTIVEARGEGSRGVRSAEWEQNRNIRIELVCKESMADAILEHLANNYYQNYAMIVYLENVEVIRPEKF